MLWHLTALVAKNLRHRRNLTPKTSYLPLSKKSKQYRFANRRCGSPFTDRTFLSSDNSTRMEEKGTRVRIISKHGYSYSSLLSVEVIQDNLRISWRLNPEKLGVDMMYLKEIVQSTTSDRRLHLLFQGHFSRFSLKRLQSIYCCQILYPPYLKTCQVTLSLNWNLRMLKHVVLCTFAWNHY